MSVTKIFVKSLSWVCNYEPNPVEVWRTAEACDERNLRGSQFVGEHLSTPAQPSFRPYRDTSSSTVQPPLTPLEAYFFTLFVLHFVYSEHDRTFYKRHECKAICNLLECDVVCLNTSMQPTLSPRPNNNHMTNPPPPPPPPPPPHHLTALSSSTTNPASTINSLPPINSHKRWRLRLSIFYTSVFKSVYFSAGCREIKASASCQ